MKLTAGKKSKELTINLFFILTFISIKTTGKNKMKNFMQKVRKGAVSLGFAATAFAGCASLPKFNQSEIYQSPSVPASYGYQIDGKAGNVDETKPAYIENGTLYIVGFSMPCASESLALQMARADARYRIYRLTNEDVIRGISTKSNEIDFVEKGGKQAYIAEVLTQTPLDSFTKPVQNRLESTLIGQ